MKVSVIKFGGSTFKGLEDYARVARYLAGRARGEKLVVIASAFAGLTEKHREMGTTVNRRLGDRTTAALLPLADSIGAQLLCGALEAQGLSATGLMGCEIGIVTDDTFTRARVLSLRPKALRAALADNDVVTIPGGQAANRAGRQAWLGKNSSDYSAVLIAKMLGARRCEIYSDTPGVYSADPNLVEGARLIPRLSWEQTLRLSLSGAKVMHYEAVRCAQRSGIEIVCRRNEGGYEVGTRIGARGAAAAVCPDLKARAFVFKSPRALTAGMRLLAERNLPLVSLSDEGAGTLVVTCGHSHPDRYLEEAGLAFQEKPGVALVTTLLRDGRIRRELVDRALAGVRAQTIHDGFRAAAII